MMRKRKVVRDLVLLGYLWVSVGSALGASQYDLPKLEAMLGVMRTPVEQQLFADAQDGEFNTHALSTAALIASGLSDVNQLSTRQTQIDQIAAQVRANLQHLAPLEQAEGLLRWLHQHQLKTYAEKQSLLPTVLDDGVYNCVSVTVLYNSIGQTLGLNLRAVETEKHVFSMLLMPTQAYDIETTTRHGFDPSGAAIERFEAKTGFKRIGSEHVAQTRVVGDVALVALIYFNQALSAVASEEHIQALHLFAKALWFDPGLKQARSSFLSLLSMQSAEWLEQKRFKSALDLLQWGLMLDPEHVTMRYNQTVGWNNWAFAEADSAHPTQALGTIQQAYRMTKNEPLIKLQAQIFMRRALAMAEQGDWSGGMALMQDGRDTIAAPSLPFLDDWWVDYLSRWLADCLAKQQYPQAYDLANAILARDKGNAVVRQNIRFLLQEWSQARFQAAGSLAAEQLLVSVLGEHEDNPGLAETAKNYVYWAVEQLSTAQQFEQAIALIARQQARLDEDIYTQLLTSQYQEWSQQVLQAKNWAQAIQILQAAQMQLPNKGVFTHNEKYAWGQWGQMLIENKTYQRAAAVYVQALLRYPTEAVFENNLRYCQAAMD